jgi:SNF2 family DNA or RNA helicase
MLKKLSEMLSRHAISINSKNMLILECLLRARQVMIWPQMYLDGIAKQSDTQPEQWIGSSKKMQTLFNMIKSHPDEKTLVFCQFRGEMDYIQKNLEGPTFRIDGSVPKEERDNQVTRVQKGATGSCFHYTNPIRRTGSQPPRSNTRLYYGSIVEPRDRTPSCGA